MGCSNGKSIRKRSKEQTIDTDPFLEQLRIFKNEIQILRVCLFQVLKLEPIEISTIEDDIKYIQEQINGKSIPNLQELIDCYQINIFKRKKEIQSLIYSKAIKCGSQQVFASETSLSMQIEKRIVLDKTTQKVMNYCYISRQIDQENIFDNSVSQKYQLQNSQ